MDWRLYAALGGDELKITEVFVSADEVMLGHRRTIHTQCMHKDLV